MIWWPNLNDNGGACFFILLCKILCNENSNNEKHMDKIEKELQYWLRFIFSNARLLVTFKPFVTITFTHAENELNFHKCQIVQELMQRLKTKFEDLVQFFEDYYAIDAHSTKFVKQVGDYVSNTIRDIFSKGSKVP
jgi:hypothetical protein